LTLNPIARRTRSPRQLLVRENEAAYDVHPKGSHHTQEISKSNMAAVVNDSKVTAIFSCSISYLPQAKRVHVRAYHDRSPEYPPAVYGVPRDALCKHYALQQTPLWLRGGLVTCEYFEVGVRG